MADRMASSDVAKRRRLNDLETSLTTPMRGRLHENIDYIVENLTERPVGDKGNDVVTYRIRMLRDRSLDPRETVIVKACPRDDSKRRREGRPEVGFSTVSCEAIPVSQTVVDEKAYTLVRDPHTGRVQDIYFSIEVRRSDLGEKFFSVCSPKKNFSRLRTATWNGTGNRSGGSPHLPASCWQIAFLRENMCRSSLVIQTPICPLACRFINNRSAILGGSCIVSEEGPKRWTFSVAG